MLVDEGHAEAEPGCRDGRGSSRDACADDDNLFSVHSFQLSAAVNREAADL